LKEPICDTALKVTRNYGTLAISSGASREAKHPLEGIFKGEGGKRRDALRATSRGKQEEGRVLPLVAWDETYPTRFGIFTNGGAGADSS